MPINQMFNFSSRIGQEVKIDWIDVIKQIHKNISRIDEIYTHRNKMRLYKSMVEKKQI